MSVSPGLIFLKTFLKELMIKGAYYWKKTEPIDWALTEENLYKEFFNVLFANIGALSLSTTANLPNDSLGEAKNYSYGFSLKLKS